MSAEERQREIVRAARRTGAVGSPSWPSNWACPRRPYGVICAPWRTTGWSAVRTAGRIPWRAPGFETTLAFRATSHVPEKRRIATAAAELFGDAETVFVDEGSTPRLIAEALPGDRPLPVVTASLATAGALAGAGDTTVLLLGGRVRPGTLATVVHWTTRMLAGFVIDLAYIGANGITRDHGLTTPDPAVSEVEAQAIRASRRMVFAGVHTKFGAVSFCRFAEVSGLDAIVKSTLLPTSEAHRHSLLGPQAIRV